MSDKEYHVLPNGLVVTFIPETHQYFVKGREVPSITQLLDRKYGNNYLSVKPEILKKASEYGTVIHEQLAGYIEARKADPEYVIESTYPEINNYFTFVEKIYNIRPIINEKVVALYDQQGEVVACGRFDMIAYVGDKLSIVDFKTTSSINRQHVTGQLNLYLTAAYQSGYIDNLDLGLGVIHLSGDKARYVPMTKLSDTFYLTFINI